jgi:hypothetical protein
MLRHKAMIQAARVAFGFAGVYDPDEGARILEGEVVAVAEPAQAPRSRTEEAKAALAARRAKAEAAEAPAQEPAPAPADPDTAAWLNDAGLGDESPPAAA